MNSPQITKISLLHLPFITEDSYEVLVNLKNFDKTKHRVIVQVNMKNYEPENNTVVIKIPTNLKENSNNIRIKAFVYDFANDKVVESKLQEFMKKNLAPQLAATMTSRSFETININKTGNYVPNDELLRTSPMILSNVETNNFFNKKPLIKKVEVKKVELITKLEYGSSNSRSQPKPQQGMVFGKSYTFKVTKFTGNASKYLNQIRWYIKFHNLTKNKWEEVELKPKGIQVTILMNNLEMCGRFVYVRAYLNNKKIFGEAKTWKHNRFRWFNREIIEDEINDRLINPWKIDQSGTSLCGMACVFYLFAKEKKNEYNNFAKTLFRTGVANFNRYNVEPSIELLEKPVNVQGYPFETGNMPLIDYITLAGVRNTDNPKYKGGNEEFQAINWIPVITKFCKLLLGYKKVSMMESISKNSMTIFEIVENINRQIDKGFRLLLIVDSDLIDDRIDFTSIDFHWVVLESKINIIQNLNTSGEIEYLLDFRVYSWGTNPDDRRDMKIDPITNKPVENLDKGYLKQPITPKHFVDNCYGFIKMK